MKYIAIIATIGVLVLGGYYFWDKEMTKREREACLAEVKERMSKVNLGVSGLSLRADPQAVAENNQARAEALGNLMEYFTEQQKLCLDLHK